MRIMIKGGVWKNTEDEILKAAVMKYGLNQWARISSLLTRKSAKQCKARWYEWLDPEIKKTEWTKEEDEKLLHLAKLFPTQWRTIAPIVGRTSAQCLERYEKLLDLALSKDQSYDPDDDPRRLRPGEIDPNPESKPARPDPVDMDEDEKEMLSEARARLANTRGKKAKRKAREKQLEEARRLAFMQKNRELRAAGIELRFRDRIRRGLDYNREIAFEKKPPIGFYDTAEEIKKTVEVARDFRPVANQRTEIKSRKHIEEALMKQDVRRQKILADHNQPAALAKAAMLNDPGVSRRRSKLMLPEPQVSEQDLLQIAKSGAAMQVDEDMVEGAGGEVTRKLLGQYDQTPSTLATPARTPRTPTVGVDRILQEAHNLAKMRTAETPLLGNENPTLFPTEFEGLTPKKKAAATPNPLAGGTPLSIRGQGGMSTPMRDELGLNASDTASVTSSTIGSAQRTLLRNQLRASLAQLPEAKNQAEVEIPELPEEEEGQQEEMELDEVDVERMKKEAAEAKALKEFRQKSQVLQRGFPRPVLEERDFAETSKDVLDKADALLEREIREIVRHEMITDPVQSGKRRKTSKRRQKRKEGEDGFEVIPEEDLKEAKLLLEEEIYLLRSGGEGKDVVAELEAAWEEIRGDVIWLPSVKGFGKESTASEEDKVKSYREQFEALKTESEREAKRVQKLEDKVKVLCTGHWHRSEAIQSSIHSSWTALRHEEIDLGSYSRLQSAEDIHAPMRLEELKDLVSKQRELEKQLQMEYKRLVEEEQALCPDSSGGTARQ